MDQTDRRRGLGIAAGLGAGLARDLAVRCEQLGYYAEHLPGAQLFELRGVDHDPWVGDTEPVLQAVEAFLAAIQPTAAQAAFVAQNR